MQHGVTTPYWQIVTVGQRPTIPIPFVIKAPRQGSTVGVHIIKNEREIDAAMADAAKYDRELLIEKFVPGRELTIGILGDQALPILEIIPEGRLLRFHEQVSVSESERGRRRRACLSGENSRRADARDSGSRACERIARSGLQVYSRVDIMLPEDGEPTVLEINTIPGMTEASLLPEAAAAAGIGYPELCARIIELSRQRSGAKQ